MVTPDRLRQLVDNAQDPRAGKWYSGMALQEMGCDPEDASLIAALGPDAARLLADAMEQAQGMKDAGYTGWDWLLERFAALGEEEA
jgi:hypothetical protein